MNASVVIFGVVAALCFTTIVQSLPLDENEQLLDVSAPTRHRRSISEFSVIDLEDVSGSSNIRQKRATCDLLSGFGVNHSACATHCVLLGRSGGYCNSQAVCICRN